MHPVCPACKGTCPQDLSFPRFVLIVYARRSGIHSGSGESRLERCGVVMPTSHLRSKFNSIHFAILHSHVTAADFEGNNLAVNIRSIQTNMNLILIHFNPQSQLLWFHGASVASLERRASLLQSGSSPPLSSSSSSMV